MKKETTAVLAILALSLSTMAQDKQPASPPELDADRIKLAFSPPSAAKRSTLDGWDKAYIAGAAADIGSSFGLKEGNPVLGRGRFGVKQAITSAGLRGGAFALTQHLENKYALDPGRLKTVRRIKKGLAITSFVTTAINLAVRFTAKR